MTEGTNSVTIRDIDIPFLRVVMILLKWTIAAVPATILAAIVYLLILALLGGIAGVMTDALGAY
jgi:hypothetical protein